MLPPPCFTEAIVQSFMLWCLKGAAAALNLNLLRTEEHISILNLVCSIVQLLLIKKTVMWQQKNIFNRKLRLKIP